MDKGSHLLFPGRCPYVPVPREVCPLQQTLHVEAQRGIHVEAASVQKLEEEVVHEVVHLPGARHPIQDKGHHDQFVCVLELVQLEFDSELYLDLIM